MIPLQMLLAAVLRKNSSRDEFQLVVMMQAAETRAGDEYVKELNRLRMEHRAKVSQGRQELTVVEREIRTLVQAIKDGVSATSI